MKKLLFFVFLLSTFSAFGMVKRKHRMNRLQLPKGLVHKKKICNFIMKVENKNILKEKIDLDLFELTKKLFEKMNVQGDAGLECEQILSLWFDLKVTLMYLNTHNEIDQMCKFLGLTTIISKIEKTLELASEPRKELLEEERGKLNVYIYRRNRYGTNISCRVPSSH